LCIAGVGFGEALSNREPGLKGFQRLGQIALLNQNGAPNFARESRARAFTRAKGRANKNP
jgi:hypothetical protein